MSGRYDPQRRHSRQRPDADEPAPVDALLDGAPPADGAAPTPERVVTRGPSAVPLGEPSPPARAGAGPEAGPDADRQAGFPVGAVVAFLVALVVVAVVVRRRRRA